MLSRGLQTLTLLRARAEKGKGMRLAIFVKLGALRRFDLLKRDTRDLPVSIEWDRRRGERRAAAPGAASEEKRRRERRSEPPFTWKAAEFVITHREDE